MTISEVSKKYDISTDTLRYYERIGLLPTVPRTKSGLRDYDENSCKSVEFIKCMRNAGLPIEALIEYMTLFKEGDSTAEARMAILIEQREALISRIEEMQSTLSQALTGKSKCTRVCVRSVVAVKSKIIKTAPV